jgi:hypothetical protein
VTLVSEVFSTIFAVEYFWLCVSESAKIVENTQTQKIKTHGISKSLPEVARKKSSKYQQGMLVCTHDTQSKNEIYTQM